MLSPVEGRAPKRPRASASPPPATEPADAPEDGEVLSDDAPEAPPLPDAAETGWELPPPSSRGDASFASSARAQIAAVLRAHLLLCASPGAAAPMLSLLSVASSGTTHAPARWLAASLLPRHAAASPQHLDAAVTALVTLAEPPPHPLAPSRGGGAHAQHQPTRLALQAAADAATGLGSLVAAGAGGGSSEEAWCVAACDALLRAAPGSAAAEAALLCSALRASPRAVLRSVIDVLLPPRGTGRGAAGRNQGGGAPPPRNQPATTQLRAWLARGGAGYTVIRPLVHSDAAVSSRESGAIDADDTRAWFEAACRAAAAAAPPPPDTASHGAAEECVAILRDLTGVDLPPPPRPLPPPPPPPPQQQYPFGSDAFLPLPPPPPPPPLPHHHNHMRPPSPPASWGEARQQPARPAPQPPPRPPPGRPPHQQPQNVNRRRSVSPSQSPRPFPAQQPRSVSPPRRGASSASPPRRPPPPHPHAAAHLPPRLMLSQHPGGTSVAPHAAFPPPPPGWGAPPTAVPRPSSPSHPHLPHHASSFQPPPPPLQPLPPWLWRGVVSLDGGQPLCALVLRSHAPPHALLRSWPAAIDALSAPPLALECATLLDYVYPSARAASAAASSTLHPNAPRPSVVRLSHDAEAHAAGRRVFCDTCDALRATRRAAALPLPPLGITLYLVADGRGVANALGVPEPDAPGLWAVSVPQQIPPQAAAMGARDMMGGAHMLPPPHPPPPPHLHHAGFAARGGGGGGRAGGWGGRGGGRW